MSTTITPPARSNAQYMAALERANEIRAFRARLKKDVKAGKESAYGIVACPPEMTATMKVFDLLLAMPKTGRVRANKLLRRCSVSPSKTLAGLSDRQGRDLLALVPHPGSRPNRGAPFLMQGKCTGHRPARAEGTRQRCHTL